MTWLSRFSVLAVIALAIAGCADHELTSLEGEVACASQTCGEGQLCKTFEPHPGESLQYSCVTVAEGCDVFDCVSEDRGCGTDCKEICPPCIVDTCGYLTRVEDRELICLGY